MKPVIVLTVYRRYSELASTLRRIRDLTPEFGEAPDVVVVWSQPEVGRLWFFQKLLSDGVVEKLLTRPALPGEAPDQPTTYPESHNIRLGLAWVREHYDPATTYAVVQAADAEANPGHCYAFIDAHMRGGAGAVVFHWPNGCIPVEIWHTNFFAVRLDPAYWPPVSDRFSQDVLEAQWGRRLAAERPPDVVKSHNYNGKRFSHTHRSELEPAWPVVPQASAQSTPLLIAGYQPWWRRLLERVGLAKPFRRASD